VNDRCHWFKEVMNTQRQEINLGSFQKDIQVRVLITRETAEECETIKLTYLAQMKDV